MKLLSIALVSLMSWPLLLPTDLQQGCGGDDDTTDSPAPSVTPETVSPGPFTYSTSDYVALPFVYQGSAVPSGSLTVEETGGGTSSSQITLQVSGNFEVDGNLAPLEAYESRTLSVRYTGSTNLPEIVSGNVRITMDGTPADVPLFSVIGDDALPGVTWSTNAYGTQATAPLPAAPYPGLGSPRSDVLMVLAPGLTDQGDLGVVTHLHGWNATLSYTVPDQELVEQHALAGRDSILIVPQGPYNQSSGDFGQLMDPGGFYNLVRDVVSLTYRDGFVSRPVTGDVVLTSHSGGYQCTAAILEQGGLTVDAVHLFDSLYAEADTFEEFVLGGGVFRSSYTSSGGTDSDNIAFRNALVAEGVSVGTSFDDNELLTYDVTVGYSASSHNGCISDERNYARWLTFSSSRRSPATPPELRQVIAQGDTAEVIWVPEAGPSPDGYQVLGSDDGISWRVLLETTATSALVPLHSYLAAASIDEIFGPSSLSDRYTATGSDFLIIDGFDRVTGGSWKNLTHDFVATLAEAMGGGCSSASNEAVQENEVNLEAYAHVLWMLGDESTADITLNAEEKAALESYLDSGGRLIISGSEIGYATSSSWLSDVLHVTYVKDDAGTYSAGNYTFGVAYDDDYPDVLSGTSTVWSYSTGGGAAVGWNHQIIVVGFALETLDPGDMAPALQELRAWLQ